MASGPLKAPEIESGADIKFENWWESQGLDGEQIRARDIDRWTLAKSAFEAGQKLERGCCGARRFGSLGPMCYQPEGHTEPHIFECVSEPE